MTTGCGFPEGQPESEPRDVIDGAPVASTADTRDPFVIAVPRGPQNVRWVLLVVVYEFVVCGLIGLVQVGLHAGSGVAAWVLFALSGLGVVGVALALHVLWLNRILAGRAWAVVLGYVAFVPAVWVGFALVAAFFLASALQHHPFLSVFVILGAPFCFAGFLLLVNVMSPGLGRWIRMNGRCPQCREWLFGRVAPGISRTCPICGAAMQFERVE